MSKNNKTQKKKGIAEEYLQLKTLHSDQLLFFQVGEFYEVFFDDAIAVSQRLNINLTKRGKYNDTDIPMCGIPIHTKELYLSKLIHQNQKIALYDQEVALRERGDGEVDSEYIRTLKQIYTPGTLTDDSMLAKNNNFLASVYLNASNKDNENENEIIVGLSIVDLSTGEFFAQELLLDELETALMRWNPKEILYSQDYDMKMLNHSWYPKVTHRDYEKNLKTMPDILNELKEIQDSEINIDIKFSDAEKMAMQEILKYILYTHVHQKVYLRQPKRIQSQNFLYIHSTAKESLELTRSLGGKAEGGLLYLINQTVTPLGSRCLTQQLSSPLVDKERIEKRLDLVQFFVENFKITEHVRGLLKNVHDVERSLTRIYMRTEKRVDFGNLLGSLKYVIQLLEMSNPFVELYAQMHDEIKDIILILERYIDTSELNIINQSSHPDYLRLHTQYDQILAQITALQSDYKAETEASSLIVKFVQGSGYIIEVSAKESSKLGYKFEGIQNLTHTRRYTTSTLNELSMRVRHIQNDLQALEKQILNELAEQIAKHKKQLLRVCEFISYLDLFTTFAYVAVQEEYTRPLLTHQITLNIKQGRHPILASRKKKKFIANDCKLDLSSRVMLLTGPNMSGKSTYMKQNLQIVILAQMGCFVPAHSALIGIADAIFTRLGAYDDISQDQSTFMQEMSELSMILKRATQHSVLILDEIGRGTTPKEGGAIAQATLEYLCSKLKARSLFATHFNKIGVLQEKYPSLLLRCMETKEIDELNLEYTYHLQEGVCHSSYGMAVAKQAGLPDELVNNALKYMREFN